MLLEHLRRQPNSLMGLSLLAKASVGERELAALWEELR